MVRARELRLLTALLLAAFCPSLTAQIFPHIEKPVVQRRAGIQPGEPTRAPEPEADPQDEPASSIDHAAVLKRFNELVEGYSRDNGIYRDAFSTHISRMHPAIRDFMSGIVQLRCGQYAAAERHLRAAGHSITREGTEQSEAVQQVMTRIRRGDAYLLRLAAATMQHWPKEADKGAMEAALSRANRAAEGIIRELRTHAEAGRLENGEGALNAAREWFKELPARWEARRSAEARTRQGLGDALAWRELAAATADDLAGHAFTTNYLVQRAALTVLKEFWPEDGHVTGGFADLELGRNHVHVLQLDAWEPFYEAKPYHSEGGGRTLAAGRIQAVALAEWYASLKVD